MAPTITPTPLLGNVVALGTGRLYSCALLANGHVVCWGNNSHGTLGTGSLTSERASAPVRVVGIEEVTTLYSGFYNSCALNSATEAHCWGYSEYGQLANGSTDDSAIPVDVPALNGASSIAFSENFGCAVTRDSQVACWGNDVFGALGDAPATDTCTVRDPQEWTGTTNACALTPAIVPGVKDATAVAVGSQHGCALLKSGNVMCWAENAVGMAGQPLTENFVSPTRMPRISSAVAIGAGYGHTCALIDSGRVFCWGWAGSIGDGTVVPEDVSCYSQSRKCWRVLPTEVPDVRATQIAVGGGHTCALDTAGEVWCWGERLQYGGNGTSDPSPRKVENLSGVTAISAGEGHTCAIVEAGNVFCWGSGEFGQLGNRASDLDSYAPLPVMAGESP